ncbi:MAG: hypothetical protein JKX73_07040 [Flavobacteriales bacterium]|nr:hypothetical protein [Flavobacteriales bacterium]
MIGTTGLLLCLLMLLGWGNSYGQDSTAAPAISVTTEEETVQDSTADPVISVTTEDGTDTALEPAAAEMSDDAAGDEDEYKPLPYFQPILGIGAGFLTYFGDLTPFQAGSRISDNLAFDFSISTRTNKYLTLELYFLKGKFTIDEKSETRNLNFQTGIEIGGLSFSHNLSNWVPEKSRIHPYISFGIEGFNFNSKGDTLDANGNPYYYWKDGSIRIEPELGTNTGATTTTRDFMYESDLRDANLDGLNRYSQFSFAIPVGVGVQYRINRRIAVELGTEMHFTFTDNLDNVSSEGTGVREGEADLERFLYTSLTMRFNIGHDDSKPPEEPEDTCLLDDDNDGVNNCLDICPETPDSIISVDSVGCAIQDTVAADSAKGDSVWTVLLDKYGPGQFPTSEFINQVLSIPGVWTEVIGDTTYYIKELFDNPEDAEVQRRNITDNTSIKDSRVILWLPMMDYNVNIDRSKVDDLMGFMDTLSSEDVYFRVQIGAFSKLIPSDFFNISDVVMIPGKDSLFKYVTGNYENDFNAVLEYRREMVAKGFDDAFIVVYRGGERVTLADVGINPDDGQDSTGAGGAVPVEQVLVFKIQIYASKDAIFLAPVNFKGVENVEEYEDGGLYKYTYGGVSDFGYASDVLLNQVRRIGYKDAFVVVFLNGKRISLEKSFEIQDQE